MSRRLMKALEDLLVHYDNTVRNASGCILQFTYGDDGMDPALMEGKDGAPLNFDRLFLKIQVLFRFLYFGLGLSLFRVLSQSELAFAGHMSSSISPQLSFFRRIVAKV